jgi:hypothetical protein
MTNELTDAQSHQVDVMHNAAYEVVARILEPLDVEPDWDMEWIGELCDILAGFVEQYMKVPEAFVYPWIGVQDGDVENHDQTTPLFWDCNCAKRYIHPKSIDHCEVCGAKRDDAGQPDSFVGEVIKWLAAGGDI